RPLPCSTLFPYTTLFRSQPGVSTNGAAWFFLYLTLGSFAYMMVYFFLEVFSFTGFFQTKGKIFLSIIFSVVLMFMLTYLFSPARSEEHTSELQSRENLVC